MHEREATETVSLFSFLKPLPLKLQSIFMPYSTLLVHLKQTEKPQNQTIKRLSLYSKRDLNPHSRNGQRILSPSCLPFHHSSILKREKRAENETRTRDPNLGKVMLYQLSYFRRSFSKNGCKDKEFPRYSQIFYTKKAVFY